MKQAHDQYPHFHWAENKGYPTIVHRKAVLLKGPSPYHRMTFKIDGIPIGERFPD
jgi:ribonuclease HII